MGLLAVDEDAHVRTNVVLFVDRTESDSRVASIEVGEELW
jgi:hypothetical protein